MRKKISLFGLLLFMAFAGLNAQTPYFYYYNGEKQYFELNTSHAFVSFADDNTANRALANEDEIPRYTRNDGEKSPSNITGVPEGRDSLYENITIYPNPTTGELEIRNYESEIKSIEVFDVYGRKVSSHHLIPSSSNHLINISHLTSGIYFVKVTTEQGEVVKKVIKQ